MLPVLSRRKILVVAAAAGVTYLPTAGYAASAQRVYRIGVLPTFADRPIWEEFVAELSRRGYTEGIHLRFERPIPVERQLALSDTADFERMVGELVKARVDVIFTQGGPGAIAAKSATSNIPIVFHTSPDPVGLGLVQSLSRPGANLTGSSVQAWETNTRELQLLAEASGKLTNVAYLIPGGARFLPSYEPATTALTAAASKLAMRIQFAAYESVRELEPLVERLVRAGVDGIAVGDAPSSDDYRNLAALLLKLRVPSIGPPSDGFLLSVGYSGPAIGRVAARQLAEVMKGVKPADIPVEQISTFELGINLRTAKALGLTIPRAMLLQATRVIR